MACLAVALLAQLLLPAMHAAVHAREHDGGHRHEAKGGPVWVITSAGGRAVSGAAPGALHHHGGVAHRHAAGDAGGRDDAGGGPSAAGGPHHEAASEAAGELAAAPATDPEHGPAHHHDGDRPGERHGAHSLEHLTAFFLEATPPLLAVPYRLVAPAVVPLVEGRVLLASVDRALPARGPPLGQGLFPRG